MTLVYLVMIVFFFYFPLLFLLTQINVPADHRVKLKEGEKRDKYLYHCWRIENNLLNMKVTVMSIVNGTLRTVKNIGTGRLGKKKREVETIQTSALLRSARIPWRLEETCCHSNFSRKPSDNNQQPTMSRKVDPLGTVQKIKSCWQMVYA